MQPDDDQMETNIKWADAFILLYSVTDRQSFQRLDAYLATIAHLRCHDNGVPALALVANKTDSPPHAHQVASHEGHALAGRIGRELHLLSIAESRDGVARVVDDVIGQARQRTGNGGGSPGAQDRMSAFTNVKRVLREKIYRGSRSDSWI